MKMAVKPGNTSFFPKILNAIAQGTINVGPVPVNELNRIGQPISPKVPNVVAYPRPFARDFAIIANQASSAQQSPWLSFKPTQKMIKLNQITKPVVRSAASSPSFMAMVLSGPRTVLPLLCFTLLIETNYPSPNSAMIRLAVYECRTLATLANTLDPDMSSSILEAIRHVFAEPATIPSNHMRSEQFDMEAAVVLQKCAEEILFVPPATLH
jgi:hypothetical protein